MAITWYICKKHDSCVDCPIIYSDEEPCEHMIEVMPVSHGHWFLLDDCSNAGVYCSVCKKKVYKEHYENLDPKSKFCHNCNSIMDCEFVRL